LLEILPEVVLILKECFWLIPLGTAIGVVAGALPGFSAANTLVVMLPITITMQSEAALIFMAAIFAGVRLGGAIPAVLINMPGTGSSSVTAFDGYPMAIQGRAAEALGIAAFASFFGGILSAIIAVFASPLLGKVALKLSSVEIFILTLFAIAVIGYLSGDYPIKGWLAGFFGLLVGSMGYDPMWGTPRGHFNLEWLADGMPVIPALVGLFAISEAMQIITRDHVVSLKKPEKQYRAIKGILLGMKRALNYRFDLIRSSLIGTIVGALPGAGANIASFISYQQAVSLAKDKSLFGKGDPRGIISGEAADNGVASGSLIPLLTLGIPGSSATAIMLVVMMAHGLSVGPRLILDNPEIFYSLLSSLFLANIWMLVIGVLVCVYMVRITEIPTRILIPAITGISLIGAFFYRGYIFDIWLALGFGLIGYVMRRTGYPPQAALLGIILSPILERHFLIGLRMGFGNPSIFFTRPTAIALWIMLIILIIFPVIIRIIKSKVPSELLHGYEKTKKS